VSGLLSGGYLAGVLATVLATMMRLAGFTLGLPPLAGPAIPFRVRAAFLMYASLAINASTGFVPAPFARGGDIDSVMALVLPLVLELLLGVALGLIVRVVFAGAEAFGHIASFSLGLGFATQVDPSTGAQSTVLARMALVIAGLVFFVADAHLPLFGAVVRTFEVFPAGDAPSMVAAGLSIAQLGVVIFDLGFRLAGPIVAIGLMVYLVLAVITKVSPQLNLFAIGFALIIPSGLLVLVVEVPDLVAILTDQFYRLPARLETFLSQGAP
jgi:flagellar biosynthetic protein FliR